MDEKLISKSNPIVRTILLPLLVAVFAACYFPLKAQVLPQAFNYQAVVRDATGQIIANQAISIRTSIVADSATGATLYAETHQPTTNAFGLANLAVGTGSTTSGNFAAIAWGGSAKYLKVEVDVAGGSSYVDMGTTQLLSVPYALYAGNSGDGLPTGTSGQTLRHNGTDWVAATNLSNNGTKVTIADGTQGNGKILTSDAAGTASWATPALGQGAFSVHPTSNVALGNSAQTIPFGSTIFNPDNAFNTSDSVFTAPANGIYHFELVFSINSSATVTNETGLVRFYKNGTSIVGQQTLKYSATPSFGASEFIGATVQLNAGETIKVVTSFFPSTATMAGGSGSNRTIFSGYRIR